MHYCILILSKWTSDLFMNSEPEKVAVKVTSERMADVLKISVAHGAEMRTSRRSTFFYPKRIGDDRFEIPPVLTGMEFLLNICEQKNSDESADVICSPKGKRLGSFWVMDERSHKASNVHARFSSSKSVFRMHVEPSGTGKLEKVSLEVESEFVRLKKVTICPFSLEREAGGKILYNEDTFNAYPILRRFRDPLKAVIRKVNCKDGAGPQFFEDSFSMVQITDKSGRSENFSVSRQGEVIALRGGMSMVGNHA